ncbi:MAG: HPr kinase [Alphaproteobacteria bacterium]|nr:HPr kinase [Alphaproteobacteria bacterium]MBU0796807.1 HPr kinase [Alphaproteobacteria bacterium]MBU0885835.1 HPr kinase [Alphaproteobacteria bacterium]MBU1812088.1 HPr kinase [Alphaproteobacteria bacterium]
MPWTGEDRPADILIHRGKVPKELPGTVRKNPLVQVNEQNWLRFTVRNVADYLVRNGNEVIIDTPHSEDTPDVTLFLLGSVLGFLCHQRGLLPLHASCVEFEGRVIAFAGQSGAGKSTIAALLLSQGARLLSDDITVIDVHAAGGPVMLPSFPRQKLWRDTIDALGLAPGRYLRSTVNLEKFDRPVAGPFDNAPVRLDGIYQLYPRMRQGTLHLMPLDNLQSVRMLYENIYRRTAAGLLGLSSSVFQNCALLAKALPHQALALPDGIDAVTRLGPQLRVMLAPPR